jgi:hypothetical protein
MTPSIEVALIAGLCSIISAVSAALITKYGLPFRRTSIAIRAKGDADECFAILPDGTFSKDGCDDTYQVSSASLKIGSDKVALSAVVNSSAGGVSVTDAQLSGDGVFANGVAYITYHINDPKNSQDWFGLMLLRVPGLGDLSGFWIAEDHIKPGHVAMGRVHLSRA